MAQFRGVVSGARGEASRLGNKVSGLTVKCDGWEAGVRVIAYHHRDTGEDCFDVEITRGSGHGEAPGGGGCVVTVRGQEVTVFPQVGRRQAA